MQKASTSEMMVNFYQTTWCNNIEDSHLHRCQCENLKSQKMKIIITISPYSECALDNEPMKK
jgi:hypothetical protein